MSTAQILVVDDERLVATAIQNELEQFGYGVTGIASSAQEAVEKAMANRPDLVLMDIQLKGDEDGIDAAHSIQARSGIPVVYLSAFSDPETVARASETTSYGYLLKPYEERELQTTIEMAIAKHRAEKKLEETQRWLSAIHNGIGEAVIALDTENRIRFINPATEALTGWQSQDAVGMPADRVCHLVDANGRIALDELIESVAVSRQNIQLPAKTWLVSKYDQETPVEGTLAAIHDRRGEFLGTVLSLRDITSRLKMERMARQSEHRRQRAEKLETTSRLAGGIAQRLESLLTSVLGDTSLALTAAEDDSENWNLLQRIEIAAQRATELVHRLSMFSSLAGRTANRLQPIDLNQLVPNCLKDIQPRLEPSIAVTFNPNEELWTVAADDMLLGQALLELALNAQDAMPHGGHLSFEVENVALSDADLASHPEGRVGEFVRLRVADTGAGMKPTVRARIFEPCFTTKESDHGSGLGLALVFAVAQQQNGWIECASHSNRGTQFDFYIPRDHDTPVEAPPLPAEKPRGTVPTILLADADSVVRDIGRRILEKKGYRVLLAEDGEQAVSVYRNEPQKIDLAILDLNMPRLTPYAVLEQMLAIDHDVHVLFSGDFFTEDLTTSEWHTLGVITKPYHEDELIEMVQRALTRHAQR